MPRLASSLLSGASRRSFPFVLAAPALGALLAACTVTEHGQGTADAATTTGATATGGAGPTAGATPAAADAADAPTNWRPEVPATIAGVPAADVRQAVTRQLAAQRPAVLSPDQWRHVQRLYKQFGDAPLWMSAEGPDKARSTALLKALTSADQDALNLDLLPIPELAQAMQAVGGAHGNGNAVARPTAAQLAQADVMLTSAYAALAEDLLTGQVDPKSIEKQDWFIARQEGRIDSAMVRSLSDPDVSRGIDRMRPQEADYKALRQQLVRYRELAAKGDWARVPAGRTTKPGEGDSPARITALRARLAAEGLLGGSTASGGVASAVPSPDSVQKAAGDSTRGQDSTPAQSAKRAARVVPPRPGQAVYDPALAGAVAAFQARHGINVDSMLGPETVNALNVPVAYRMGQIAANLERYRWLPRTLGTKYVIANVPAFRLEAWDGNKKAMEMKVVVGKDYEDKKTPVFADSMQTVVFRPYWNITDEIAAKETWPKIRANPNYMAENDLETFQEGGKTHLRQKPGPKNSLGLVKFLFPNSFNIYFHDTPEKQLFNKDVRGFSHGCIRLEKPAELASWVLGWPADRVRQAMNDTTANNKSVPLPQKLPVYIAYFTTYMKDGQLYFGNDLYDRDKALVQAMEAKGGQSGDVVRAVSELRQLVAE